MDAEEHPKQPGLRERKRKQQHETIQRAALDLMVDHGYEAVTVEMICEAAEISRRTFFNYFGSKESVVLGSGPPLIPEEAQEAFVAGPAGSILPDLARMLLTLLSERPEHVDPALWRARLETIRSNPGLATLLADRIAEKDAALQDLVERRIRNRHAEQGLPAEQGPATEAQVSRQAGVVVALWWGIARYTAQSIVLRPEISSEELTESLLDTLTLIQEAAL